ncbi:MULTISPECIES: heavy metal sensor histidine kinase [unclassified Methylibium]|uniref:heavy metal sensor histidine kinase n=1 Tax=unclassified Methylibium TaxID=2633235 RepID=UPI0003F43BC6|nr:MULTISPECIES: heavy metal sensor histidine kinase [unclassified Methylibium]EWS56564.1 Sensor protein CzcS precursor [Methylibium sp. T29]EWS61516.1 Sensor protein CzcS precursor [Methylibium sp. T29-B]
MSRRTASSLGRRLSSWLALQSLAGLAAVCAVVYAVTDANLSARQLEAIAEKETQVRHLLAESVIDSDTAALKHKLDDFFVGHRDLALSLRRRDGTVFYENLAPAGDSTGVRAARFDVPSPAAKDETLSATLSLDTRDDRSLLWRLGLTLVAAAIAGAMLVSAGGFLLVRIGLRPVRDLVEQTRRLAADTLHARLDGSAQPEELQPLIAQFNALLGRLGQAYEQLEGFNADVAHELCTPLATLIGSTELALRKARGLDELRDVLGCNLEELQRITRIVQDMLFLSHANQGAAARRVPVESLAAVARVVGDYHEAALAEAGLHLEVIGDAAGEFDAPLLQRALSNLVANATRFAERGTVIRVEIGAAQSGEATISVVDHGLTIGAEHLPRLFDRFYRIDRSRSSAAQNHGLGLSIVAAVARMHGGRAFARSAHGDTSIGMTLQSGPAPGSAGDLQG